MTYGGTGYSHMNAHGTWVDRPTTKFIYNSKATSYGYTIEDKGESIDIYIYIYSNRKDGVFLS